DRPAIAGRSAARLSRWTRPRTGSPWPHPARSRTRRLPATPLQSRLEPCCEKVSCHRFSCPHLSRVYSRCMSRTRTNIEIADRELAEVMRRYGLRTKTEAVDLALRQLAGQPMTREEALAMRGRRSIEAIPADPDPRPA